MEQEPTDYLWDSSSPLPAMLESDVLMSFVNDDVDYTGDMLIPSSDSGTQSFDDDMSMIFEGSDESETLGWVNSDMDELTNNFASLPYQEEEEEMPAPVPDPPSVLSIKEELPNSPHNSESFLDEIQPFFGQDADSLLTIPAGTQNVPGVAQQHEMIFQMVYDGGKWYPVMEEGDAFPNIVQQLSALPIPAQEIKQQVEMMEIKYEEQEDHTYRAHNASLSPSFPGNSVMAIKPTLIAKQDPIPNDLPPVRKRKQVFPSFGEIPLKKQKIEKAVVNPKKSKVKKPKATEVKKSKVKKPKATATEVKKSKVKNPKATATAKKMGRPEKRLYEFDELAVINDPKLVKQIIRAKNTKSFHDYKKGRLSVLERIIRLIFRGVRGGIMYSIIIQEPGLFQDFERFCHDMMCLLN